MSVIGLLDRESISMRPLVERAEGCNLACHGCWGVVLLAEESEVCTDEVRIRFTDCLCKR